MRDGVVQCGETYECNLAKANSPGQNGTGLHHNRVGVIYRYVLHYMVVH
jgi:hypothetical protein